MATLYVTLELAIAEDANDELIADAVFDVVCRGDWCLDQPLDTWVQSVDSSTYRRTDRPDAIRTPR